jgi:hypothetical protein
MPSTDESWGDTQSNLEFPGADFGNRDTYTEVTHTGWLQRLMGSFMGAVFGVLIFLGSFVLLYWNEGRLDISSVAKTAVEVPANQPAPAQVGKLVAVTGPMTTNETLGDAYFAPGSYVAVRREAQMFAWEEESHTETKTNAGGSETKVTTYSYSTKWTSSPENSSSFKRGGHHNPQMAVKGATLRAKEATVGAFGLEMADVDLPAFKSVALDEDNTQSGRVSGDYLYLNDRPSSPRVGDIRLSYDVVPSGQKVTLFGRLDAADHVATYTHKSGDTLYRAVNGTKADAVETMHGEHVMMTWILRAVGFGMMWMGLAMVLEPINVFLDVLPFLGGLGRGLTGFGTFLVAALLSVVTVIVSIVFHNLFAMIAIGIATVAVGAVLFSKKGARTARRVVPQA